MMFKNLNPSGLSISGHQSEIIELALTYGFSGMDLSAADFASRAKHKGMPYARRLLDSAKIRLGNYPLGFNIDIAEDEFKKNLARLPEIAHAASEVGCTRCTVTLPPTSDSRPYHDNFEFHRGRLAEVCKTLQPFGVRLAVGFQAAESLRKNAQFEFIHDLDALLTLVNMVDAGNLGVLLDVWEVFVAGGSVETIRKVPAQKLVSVQVAELTADVAPTEVSDSARLLPVDARGKIGLAAVMSAIQQIGFDGPVTPKVARGAFTTRKRDLVVKQAGEAMEQLWQAANLPAEPRRVAAAPARDFGP
ncbi:MAG: sugar phosphate isomerase/epimerase family protein [Planctomycetota bacterium]